MNIKYANKEVRGKCIKISRVTLNNIKLTKQYAANSEIPQNVSHKNVRTI